MGPTRGNRKKGLFSKKAQVEVITVMLILGITVAAVFVAYQFAAPQIERSKDVSRINSMQKVLLELDNKIREVRFEGEGSQRYIDINFDKGNIDINQNDDTILFFMAAPGISSAPQETGMDTYFTGGNINIKLQYGGEIEILSDFNLLSPSQYRIYIKNQGGNNILLSLTPDIPITGDTWTLQGYVYDNTEGGDHDGAPDDEVLPSMDNDGNNKILDAIDDAPLAAAEISFYNKKLELVAITKTNSQGRYAVKLPKSDGVNDLELYISVSLTSYVMKENHGDTIYAKTSLYHKDFDETYGTWHVNINDQIGTNMNDFTTPSSNYIDGFFNIPMYKLTREDIFETAPIALVIGDTGAVPNDPLNINDTNFDNLLFDVMDAFDNTPGSNYNSDYFVVYGSVDSPQAISKGGGLWLQYPGTTENIYMYPIEWLLDPNSDKGPVSGEYGTFTMFSEIASIDDNPDILNYKDFSLILVSSGACNDTTGNPNTIGLLEKLHVYQDELSDFTSLDRLNFKGIDFSRGIVVFGQFSEVDGVDPNTVPHTKFYPDVSNDRIAPFVTNVFIGPDGQDGQFVPLSMHPKAYINNITGGKAVFAADVKDSNQIISVVAVIMQGGVNKASVILLDNGIGVHRVSGDGTYTGEWAIPVGFTGTYQVSINSIDEYGNLIKKSTFINPETGTDDPYQMDIVIDGNIPVLINPSNPIMIYPSNITTSSYAYVNSTVLDIDSGIDRIMYGLTRVQVDGHPNYTDNHTWGRYQELSEGNNSYSIVTYDRAGNTLTQEFTILKDTSSPVILSTYTISPLVSASYIDYGIGVQSANLYVDGTLYGPEGVGSIEVSYNETILPPLPQGTHSAVAHVTDSLGNFVVFPFQFDRVSPGPSLQITSPANFLTFTQNNSITVTATTTAANGISYEVNNVPQVNPLPLNLGLNRIIIKADDNPIGIGNDTINSRWVIYDTTAPTLTIDRPTSTSPEVVKAGGVAHVTFTYTENYPAYYKIKVLNGATLISETTTTLNTAGATSIRGGGTHQIVGSANIPTSTASGLYDIEITMFDLAGNSVLIPPSANDIIKVDASGPTINVVSPVNNSTAKVTDLIQVSITDVNAGVDRKSIRMFVLGETNSSGAILNVEVTSDLDITPITNGYTVIYKPSWPFEDIEKVNVSIEASDKVENKGAQSWFYLLQTDSPFITNLASDKIAKEGETVEIGFTLGQCVCPTTVSLPAVKQNFNAIEELTINIGKLGKIVYVADSNQNDISRLVYDSTKSTLGGDPAYITVTYDATGGTCPDCDAIQMLSYKYDFTGTNTIKFVVPGYAGDTYNNIAVIATNYNSMRKTNTEDLYLITAKDTKLSGGTTYAYGKYSWLPKFEGADLSIGRVSTEPVGLRYQIYGQVYDVHRRFPVIFVSGSGNDRIDYVNDNGDSIEWDHGKIPLTFSKSSTGGSYTIDLGTRQNNVEKFSLENPIMSVIPNEFPLCVHGTFDTTNTGWTSANFMLREKQFTSIKEERGSGSSINIPASNGGPILLIKENRDTFDNLTSAVIVTTADLDRYKNNRQADGQNMHTGEAYENFARNLEENIIVWACGHELLIEN